MFILCSQLRLFSGWATTFWPSFSLQHILQLSCDRAGFTASTFLAADDKVVLFLPSHWDDAISLQNSVFVLHARIARLLLCFFVHRVVFVAFWDPSFIQGQEARITTLPVMACTLHLQNPYVFEDFGNVCNSSPIMVVATVWRRMNWSAFS